MTSRCSEIRTKLLEGWMAIMAAVQVAVCATLCYEATKELYVENRVARKDIVIAGKYQPPVHRSALEKALSLHLRSSNEKVSVSVCVSVRLSVVSGMSNDDGDEEGRRGNQVTARSLLLSNSTKGAARLNVPIRRTNHYQQ
ncbi:hypothetical protein ANN_23480 [Periplaneta americana]|uniref:Uncharacterized protein n=1 Tax=Periplaneta americana TaxID=6978 RepID=A0ABQ8SL68_PERAM|nr:hypothetical protein ANN_23480 [Periplaneta americana]